MWLHLADVRGYVLECFRGSTSVLYGGHRGTLHHHEVETADVGEAVVEREDDERAPGVVDGNP